MAASEAVVDIEPAASASDARSVLDSEFEEGIRRWKSLGEEAQREQLAPVVKSFGVGGP